MKKARKKTKVYDKEVCYQLFFGDMPITDDGEPVTYSTLKEAKSNRHDWEDGATPNIARVTTEFLDI